jgi:hypothetical protein
VEIETQLMIAQNLGYISPLQGRALLDSTAELGKVLNGLIRIHQIRSLRLASNYVRLCFSEN